MIPGIAGPAPTESFTAQWRKDETVYKPRRKRRQVKMRTEWSAIAKQDVWLKPESIATITAISKGAPKTETMFLEATPLKRSGDSFISAPHGLVELNDQDCFLIKIANTTKKTILLRSGELVGRLLKAKESLKSADQLSETELGKFSM